MADRSSPGGTLPVTNRWRAMRVPPPVLVGLFALALYLLTMAPTVLWGDDAELQRIVYTGEPRVIGQSSRASHLLWLTLAPVVAGAAAWLPLDAAGRVTLVSALCAAAALPFVYLAGRELAEPAVRRASVAGLAAAAALGLSHTFWLLAARPDVYTLQTALLAATTWLVLRWRRGGEPAYLLAAALAFGAALTNHAMILFSSPGLGALALAAPAGRRRRLAAGAVAVVAAAGLLALLALAGAPLGELGRTVAAFRPAPPPVRSILLAPVYLAYQFPLSLALAAWGGRCLWRTDRGALAGTLLLYGGNLALTLLVRVRDQFLFFLPSYLPVALLIGVGWAALWERHGPVPGRLPFGRRRAHRQALLAAALAAPLAVYPLAAALGAAAAARLAPARHLPGRDPATYYLLPAKSGYTGARAYGEAAMATLEPGAVVVADWLPYQTLRYLQAVEGARPDVRLEMINAGQGAQLRFLLDQQGRRPLYLADASPMPYYELQDIERCFTIARAGVVFRLAPREPAGTGAVCR